MTFGKRGGGGRRESQRLAAPLPALLSNTVSTQCAVVEDVSCTGVRLQGDHLPDAGSDILIKMETLSVFGRVVWSNAGECGVKFDEPLTRGEVLLLAKDADAARFRGLSPEERIALQDWNTGLAR